MTLSRFIQIVKALLNCFEGFAYKIAVDFGLLKIPALNSNVNNNIIVSLTSYGRRVSNNVVYYTVCSILRQNIKPDKIVLSLDYTNWNEDNLPPKLLSLKSKGVEFLFCEDLKSYKKLVPTLEKYPEYTIITVDDDCIYPRNALTQLLEEHEKNPSDIICLYAMNPIVEEGVPVHYKDWGVLKKYTEGKFVFPIGAAGVLYPPDSLCGFVSDKELFQKLSPLADDIWFWFCALYKGTNKIFVPRKKETFSFDMLYQNTHKGSSLTHTNKHQGKNDEQFKNIFDHFRVRIQDDNLISNTNDL